MWQEEELEGRKMLLDVAKHLTTLSSGSILLLTTLLKDVFENDVSELLWLRPVILLVFSGSLLCAVVVAWLVPLAIIYQAQRNRWQGEPVRERGPDPLTWAQDKELGARKLRGLFYRLSGIFFFLGVLFLAFFGMSNFNA
jgi:hypothetical protein